VILISFLLFLTSLACSRTIQISMGSEPTATAPAPTAPAQAPTATTPPTAQPAATIPPTQTPLPPVVLKEFSLLFYPPLVMDYNQALWLDKTQYGDPNAYQTNFLQSASLESCRIGIQGPTEFPSMASETVQLGQVQYIRYLMGDGSGSNSAWYIENKSLPGYNYEAGLPIPFISSSLAEWDQCRQLGEAVLSTLSTPQ